MKTVKQIALLFASLYLLNGQAQSLKITPLCKDVFVFTTYNEFKGNQVPANGLYLLTAEGVVMIDTPWDTLQFQPLLDSIEKRHQMKVVLCISTHSHDDRTAGLEYYRSKGIKTYTSALTKEFCVKNGEKQPEFTFSKDTTFMIGNTAIKTFYPGAGHTADNIVVWIANKKILYGGCFIKSTESTDLGNVKDASVSEWTGSINKTMKAFPKAVYVLPGHFSWENKNSLKHTLKLIEEHKKNSD